MTTSYEIIGSGNRGRIIYPSFNDDYNMVSKISDKETILKEINNIKLLPNSKAYKLPSDPKIKKLNTKELNILFELDEPLYENNKLYYYNIPYIKGETLEEIFENMEENIDLYDEDQYVIFLKAFIKFRKAIKKLNKKNICHGSLYNVNMIFTGKRIYAIDFETIGIISEIEDYENTLNNDLNLLNSTLIRLLFKGLHYTRIRNILLDNGIINLFKYENFNEDNSIIFDEKYFQSFMDEMNFKKLKRNIKQNSKFNVLNFISNLEDLDIYVDLNNIEKLSTFL